VTEEEDEIVAAEESKRRAGSGLSFLCTAIVLLIDTVDRRFAAIAPPASLTVSVFNDEPAPGPLFAQASHAPPPEPSKPGDALVLALA
jgi:hypothetical protein